MAEQVRIGDALEESASKLKGLKFSKEELELVDAAFARLGRKRPSDDKGECAALLLKLMAN